MSYLEMADWPEGGVAGEDWDLRPAAERAVAMHGHLLRPLVGEGTPSPRAPPIPGVRERTPPPPVRSTLRYRDPRGLGRVIELMPSPAPSTPHVTTPLVREDPPRTEPPAGLAESPALVPEIQWRESTAPWETLHTVALRPRPAPEELTPG